MSSRRNAYGEVLLVGEHKVDGIGVVGAVGFIDDEFFLLLFRQDGAKKRRMEMEMRQWEDPNKDKATLLTA